MPLVILFRLLQVGRNIWKEVLAGKKYKLFVAEQPFAESVEPGLLPPYR